MNTAELDEWFTRAEDVLTDWEGSDDAMDTGSDDATVSEEGIEVLEIIPDMDAFHTAFSALLTLRGAVTDLTGVMGAPHLFALPACCMAIDASRAAQEIAGWWDHADLRARALEARRSRNTGPSKQRRLDGTRARR